MRPLELQVEGINSFKEKQTIDFEELTADGFFGIFGPTGSGKSTVIDAVCLSLYGKVHRGGRKCRFINNTCKSAYASLKFAVDFGENEGKVYRIERTFRYAKNDDVKQTVNLYAVSAEGAESLLTAEAEAAETLIEQLIGFKYSEFTVCSTLASGTFNALITGARKEQVALVSSFFGLSRYGAGVVSKITEKIQNEEKEIYALQARIDAFGDISKESIAQRNEEIAEKKAELKQLNADIKTFAAAVDKSKNILENRRRVEAIDEALKQYDEKKLTVEESREALKKAIKVGEIMPKLQDMLAKQKKVLEFSAGLKSLNESLKEKSQYEISEYKKYEDLKEDVYNQVLALQSRKDRFEIIKDDVRRMEELKTLGQNIEEEYAELNKELDKKITERESLSELLAKSEKFIESLGDDISTVSVSPEAVKAISFARDVEIERNCYANQLKEVERKLDSIGYTRADLQNRIKAVSQEAAANQTALDKANEKIQDIYGAEAGRNEILCRMANDNVARHKAVEMAKHINNNIKALRRQNEINLQKIDEYREGSSRAKDLRESADADMKKIKEAFEKTSSDREEYLGSKNFLNLVINELNMGDTCPICHNTIQTLVKDPDASVPLETFDEQIRTLKRKLAQSTAKFEDADVVKSELDARADELSGLIEVNNNKIIFYQKERDKIISEYIDVKPDDNIDFDNILRYSDEQISVLQKLVDEANQKEKSVFAAEKILERYSTELAAVNVQEEDLKKEHEQISARIGELNMQYFKYEEVLKDTSARSISDIIIENDGKKEKTMIKLSEQKEIKQMCLLHIKELDGEISEIKVKINSLAGMSESYEKERKDIDGRIAGAIPDGSSVEKEQAVCQEKINALLISEQRQRAKYEEITRLIKLIDAKLAEQHAMYRIMRQDLNAKKKEGMLLIKQHGFESVNDMKRSYLSPEAIESLDNDIKVYDREISKLEKEKESITKEIAGFTLSDEELQNAGALLAENEQKAEQLNRELMLKESGIEEFKGRGKIAAELKAKIAECQTRIKKLNRLNDLVGDGKLLDYVAEDYIQLIADNASKMLFKLSGGRYTLIYEEDFVVIDSASEDVRRDVVSLSGGESFLISISIALAFSTTLAKAYNKPLSFIFLDEGFGSLDGELLSSVAENLQQLSGKNLTIGVISHMKELQDKTPVKLILTPPAGNKGSKISILNG